MLKSIKFFFLGLLLGGIVVGTVSTVKAYLAKQKVLGESTVSSAVLDLSTTPQSALFNFSKIAPGFSSGEKVVTVKNTGTVGLKYRLTASVASQDDNNDLFQSLKYSLKSYNSDGSLSSTYGSGTSLLKDLQNLEIDQTLAEGEEKQLKMEITLPETAGSEVEGLTTNFKLVFEAMQEDGVW